MNSSDKIKVCYLGTNEKTEFISNNPVAPLKLMRKIEGIAYGDYFNAFASLYSVLEQRKELVNHMKLNLIKKEHHEMLQYLDNIIKDVLFID